jgi:hypothetical protein
VFYPAVVSGADFPAQNRYEDKWELVMSKEVYIDVFLLRKKDGKRLELTKNYEGNQPLFNGYLHEVTGEVDESLAANCDDGLWRWDLPACPDPNLALHKAVRFEATLHYKDRNERPQVPPNLDEAEFDSWLQSNGHVYDLLLSGFKISLAGTRHPEDWEYEGAEDPEDYPRPTYRNNDVDDLLATVGGPGWSQRWM